MINMGRDRIGLKGPAIVVVQEQGVETATVLHDGVQHAEPLALLKIVILNQISCRRKSRPF